MIHTRLANGVEVVIKENRFSPAVAVQCWVAVGSRDETASERGMAHFLEHMLFKGTKRRAVGEIAATVEACGGEINAYTSFERTVFYLTLAKQHAETGVDLLADAILNSTFDGTEFEREKAVILEEIKRGLDNPGQVIGRRVFELCFKGTEVGRPIIGSSEEVSSYNREDLVRFHEKWYQPQNLTVVIVGDVDSAAALNWVMRFFGDVKGKPAPDSVSVNRPKIQGPLVSLVKGDYEQPRVEIVYPAPDAEHPDAPALDLVAYGLGGGELSRLNRRLRDDEGAVTAIGVSQFSPSFGGIFEVSAIMTEDKVKDAVFGIAREVMRMTSVEPLTEVEASRARVNIKAERVFRDETVEGQARSLGYGLTTKDKLLFDDLYYTKLDCLDLGSIDRASRQWLTANEAVIVALVPNSSTLTEQDLKKAFTDGVSASDVGESRVIVRAPSSEKFDKAEVFDIRPGLKFVYRRNPEGQIFSLTAATEGGLRAESRATSGMYNAMSGLLAAASKNHSYEDFLGGIEDLGGSLESFSGKDSFGFSLQCLSETMGKMLPYLREAMFSPVFPEHLWTTIVREVHAQIAAQQDSPSGIAIRRFQELIYGDHPYSFPVYGNAESLAAMSPDSLLENYLANRDKGPWVIAAAGPDPSEVVLTNLELVFQGFSPTEKKRRFPEVDSVAKPKLPVREDIEKQREQTHIVVGYHGLTWGDPDRAALDVMTNILGGHGGRMFVNLRDRRSLAYTVSPIVTYGCQPGVVGAYIATAPERAEEAEKGLFSELHAMAESLATDAEFTRARNYIVGNHEMGLQRSDAQTSTMALMELYGFGYDDFIRYVDRIMAVTKEDVKRVASRIFSSKKAATVVVGPAK